jgi:adenylylsulfate kinase
MALNSRTTVLARRSAWDGGGSFHAERFMPAGEHAGITVWLTGLPSAGKSTIARRAAVVLASSGSRVEVLDGDELRTSLCADLGFSRADRDMNVRRIGFVAELLARNGIVVLAPVIAPYADSRAAVRAHHERSGTAYREAFVDTPVPICAERDVKGLYAMQRTGKLTGLTGVDDVYEPPAEPDVVVPTVGRSVDESVALLLGVIARAGISSGTPRC